MTSAARVSTTHMSLAGVRNSQGSMMLLSSCVLMTEGLWVVQATVRCNIEMGMGFRVSRSCPRY